VFAAAEAVCKRIRLIVIAACEQLIITHGHHISGSCTKPVKVLLVVNAVGIHQ
jgi:hypothetical protein